MRHIGNLPNDSQARRLSDYLLTFDIKTKVEPEGREWALWVFEEDQVDQARREFEEFVEHPDDPRYGEARTAPAAMRCPRRRLPRWKKWARRL